MSTPKKKQSTKTGAPYVRASDVKPEKVRWLWENRIPRGKIVTVAGKPDQGKGLFAVHVAATVTRRQQNVLYSAMEDDPGTMTRPRLEAAGANLDRVLMKRFRIPDQTAEIATIVREQKIRLVVMDPFAASIGRGVHRHSDSIREALQPITELAEETDCSFLIVEHALKRITANAHPLSVIGGGSSGLPAASRAAYIFGVDPADEDRRILCPAKFNLGPWPKPLAFETDVEEFDVVGDMASLVKQGETEFDVKRLLSGDPDGGGQVGRKADKRAAAAEWLTTYLFTAGMEVPAREVLEDGIQRGHARKTVRRAATDMEVVKNPPGGGKNCTWRLPDEVMEVLAESEGADDE